MTAHSLIKEFEADALAVRFNIPVNVRTTNVDRPGASPYHFTVKFSIADMDIAAISVVPVNVGSKVKLRLSVVLVENTLSAVQARLHHAIVGKILDLATYFEVRLNDKEFDEVAQVQPASRVKAAIKPAAYSH